MLYTCLYFYFVCYVGFTFARKRKVGKAVGGDEEAHTSKHIRNRASPFYLALLCDHLTNGQKDVVRNMEFVSMLDIKCSTLQNPAILWFVKLYDKKSHEFVVPGQGRIPLNEVGTHHTLGLPVGCVSVPYSTDGRIEAYLAPEIFLDNGKTPTTSRMW
jgi:hypothetical protein